MRLKTREEIKVIRLQRLKRKLLADVRRINNEERDKKFRQELKEDRVWRQAHHKTKSSSRVIMEAHIRRKLKRGEVVHHIDYDHSNNAIENLRLMTNEAHARFHNRKEEKSRARQIKAEFYNKLGRRTSVNEKRGSEKTGLK